ncbi:hypothetical protein D3C81_2132220 [compost metagenome]
MPLQPEDEGREIGAEMHLLFDLQFIFIQGKDTDHSGDNQQKFIGTQHLLANLQKGHDRITLRAEPD